jgi:endonuclease YncB( thermonuclease family)
VRARRRSLALALCVAAFGGALGTGFAAPACRRDAPPAAGLVGKVVAIHDGDTLSVRLGGDTERVRLAQIDAPERGQPWGRRAKEALGRLAAGREARLVVVDRDDYGRPVADLYVGELFVNEALVRGGDAWAYPRYVRHPQILAAEDEARRDRRGLWRLPAAEREPPWEWRRAHRGERRESRSRSRSRTERGPRESEGRAAGEAAHP